LKTKKDDQDTKPVKIEPKSSKGMKTGQDEKSIKTESNAPPKVADAQDAKVANVNKPKMVDVIKG
jgi:hypothetical protein